MLAGSLAVDLTEAVCVYLLDQLICLLLIFLELLIFSQK